MVISDRTYTYLKIFCALIVIVYFIYDESTNKFSCDEWANSFRKDKQFSLVLTEKENHNNQSRDAYFYGTDLENKKHTEFYDGSGWISRSFDKFKIGDTLIKRKGKYTIIIKRKYKTILIPFECEGKIYQDK